MLKLVLIQYNIHVKNFLTLTIFMFSFAFLARSERKLQKRAC